MSEFVNDLLKRDVTSFNKYIKKIRFPYFKKLKPHSEIIFDFPFTVLVGANGSGKSSTLQALYGCPNGKNVSDFWFSTSLDPIKEGGKERNRFIYKFQPKKGMPDVEVIKQRTKRSATSTRLEDPDYWETARPSIKDGMEKMPPFIDKHKDYRSDTRWRALEKDVVYIDFRAELSAFDKFFYFGTYKKRPSLKTKQDFIRHRSKALNGHLTNQSTYPQTWHYRTTKSVEELTKEELSWVNKILGKNYLAAKIVEHDFYNNDGYSIIFTNSDENYTEAVAGSGEVSVVNCVVKILKASRNSLILLDEPEVSLHPGAQNELRNLLLESSKQHGHQVVLSTHSEYFVQGLPNNAVKLFQYNNAENCYEILSECSPHQAFLRLGVISNNKKKIYVEDELAKILVEEALKEIDPELLKSYFVIPYQGGASTIVGNLLVQFLIDQESNQDIVILDGDMLKSVHRDQAQIYQNRIDRKEIYIKEYSSDIPEKSHYRIDEILQEQIKGLKKDLNLPTSGGDEKLKLKLNILDLYHEKFHFINVDTPEEFIWKIAEGEKPTNIDAIKSEFVKGVYKDRFEKATISNLGKEETNSKTIYNLQLAFLKKRNIENPLWLSFKTLISNILGVEKIN